MPKYKHLRGIVNDLSDSFISACNMDFTREIESIGRITKGKVIVVFPKKLKFKIDLMKSVITPRSLQTEQTQKTIEKYRKWLFNQMKSKCLSVDELKSVVISFEVSSKTKKTKINHITLKPQESTMLSIYWSAKSEIKIKDGRVFRGESQCSWMSNLYSKKAMEEMLRSVPFKFTIEEVLKKIPKGK